MFRQNITKFGMFMVACLKGGSINPKWGHRSLKNKNPSPRKCYWTETSTGFCDLKCVGVFYENHTWERIGDLLLCSLSNSTQLCLHRWVFWLQIQNYCAVIFFSFLVFLLDLSYKGSTEFFIFNRIFLHMAMYQLSDALSRMWMPKTPPLNSWTLSLYKNLHG